MQNSQKRIEKLTLADLKSRGSFKIWLQKHINISNEGEVFNKQVLMLLDQIKDMIIHDKTIQDVQIWLKAIEAIKHDAERYEQSTTGLEEGPE